MNENIDEVFNDMKGGAQGVFDSGSIMISIIAVLLIIYGLANVFFGRKIIIFTVALTGMCAGL